MFRGRPLIIWGGGAWSELFGASLEKKMITGLQKKKKEKKKMQLDVDVSPPANIMTFRVDLDRHDL